MQIRSLEIFCDVARLRSFSKAADARGVSQSAVSQTIQHLEEILGVKLIDRSSRPLALTSAGETYHHGLTDILREYQGLVGRVVRSGRTVDGPLHVAAIYSVGLTYMRDATEEFAERFPEVEVHVDYGRSEAVLDRLMNGEVEIGLVSFPQTTKDIVAVPWQKEPMRLVCSPGHPLAGQTEVAAGVLNGIKMVGFDRTLELRAAIDRSLKQAGIRAHYDSEFDNTDSIIRAIQANDGVSILPEAAVRREIASGALRVVACRALKMTRPLGIVYRRSSRPSRAGYEFASLLLGRPLDPEQEDNHRSRGGAGYETGAGTSVVA